MGRTTGGVAKTVVVVGGKVRRRWSGVLAAAEKGGGGVSPSGDKNEDQTEAGKGGRGGKGRIVSREGQGPGSKPRGKMASKSPQTKKKG